MNLFRSRKGQWFFDRYVSSGTSSENAVLYQQSDKSPKPLEERAWVFEGIPVDLKLTPITQGRKDRPDVDPITKGKKNRPDGNEELGTSNTKIVIIFVAIGAFISLLCIHEIFSNQIYNILYLRKNF